MAVLISKIERKNIRGEMMFLRRMARSKVVVSFLVVCLLSSLCGSVVVGKDANAQQRYEVIHLGTLGGDDCNPTSVNNNGQVVGFSKDVSGYNRAFVWNQQSGILELPKLDGTDSYAFSINDSGQIAGSANTSSYVSRAVYWKEENNQYCLTNLHSSLGGTEGQSSSSGSINEHGWIVGYLQSEAYIWKNETKTALGNLGGDISTASSINDNGQVVGSSSISTDYHAYLWEESAGMVDLGTLPGGKNSFAHGINNAGQVVGDADTDPDSSFPIRRAYLWSAGAMTELGTLEQDNPGSWSFESCANDINNLGQVVGWSDVSGGGTKAFLWEESSGMVDLNTLIPLDSGWVLQTATGLNEDGWIVGKGTKDGLSRQGFLLIPQQTSDSFTVTFTVTDQQQSRLQNAEVIVSGIIGPDYTDINGEVTFNEINTGIYTYTINLSGFEEYTGSFEITNTSVYIWVNMMPEEVPPATYTVIFSVEGDNGAIAATVDDEAVNSGDNVEEDKDIVFTASPDTGYQVKEWTVNGLVQAGETGNVFTLVNLQAAAEVKVTFEVSATATGTIAGTVYSSGGGALPWAIITLPGTSYQTFSLSDGSYTLANVPVGSYTVSFAKSGYGSGTLEDITVSGDNETTANISLSALEANVLGNLPVGSIVVDNTWQWEHRTGGNYTGDGETKPLEWIVVGQNHYADLEAHTTLFTKEVIARYVFDDSTDRGHTSGSNHWGNSGTTNANHGLRPFLNTTFFNAFSSQFKNRVLTTPLPNKPWDSEEEYITDDNVFVLALKEVGGGATSSFRDIGNRLEYFINDATNKRKATGVQTNYWMRNPEINDPTFLDYVKASDGGCYNAAPAYYQDRGVRPAINLRSDTPVKPTSISGIYEMLYTYTVTFEDYDGSLIERETVAYGCSATAPADPTREGYTFIGWDVGFDNITADVTVTAQYEVNYYTVTFNDYDGSLIETETVAHGCSATAPADPIREGYTFIGWDVGFDNITSDVTVIAQYAINQYTIEAIWEVTEGSVEGEGTYEHGAEVTLTATPAYNRKFLKWTENDVVVSTDPSYTFTITSDRSLVAHFEEEVAPYFKKHLSPGWNTLSVPVRLGLEKDSLKEIVSLEKCELFYAYDPLEKKWNELGGESLLKPMDGIFVKVKQGESDSATLYPYEELTPVPERTLNRGWNLIGPALDIGSPQGYKESAGKVFVSLRNKYSQIISQRLTNQPGWSYVPEMDDIPGEYYGQPMYAGSAYWVYLLEDAVLAGFSYTPVGKIYQIPDDEMGLMTMSSESDDAAGIPELPAAFYGSVRYAGGEAVAEGTIEVIINGQVQTVKAFSEGYYGLTHGQRLLIEKYYLDQAENIRFRVNNQEATAEEVIDWSDSSGKLIQLNLVVTEEVSGELSYHSVAVSSPQTVELQFSRELEAVEDLESLKTKIFFADDGVNFQPLGENDCIEIQGSKLIVELARELAGTNNRVKVLAGAVQDPEGNILAEEVITAPFEANVVDECFIATAAFGSKLAPAVALLRQFRDKRLLTNRPGQAFVRFYYSVSPPLAASIAGSEFFKGLVRALLLPVIAVAYLLLNQELLLIIALTVCTFILFSRRRRRLLSGR